MHRSGPTHHIKFSKPQMPWGHLPLSTAASLRLLRGRGHAIIVGEDLLWRRPPPVPEHDGLVDCVHAPDFLLLPAAGRAERRGRQ
eukprot:2391887-Prymnesium_polylepis.2